MREQHYKVFPNVINFLTNNFNQSIELVNECRNERDFFMAKVYLKNAKKNKTSASRD